MWAQAFCCCSAVHDEWTGTWAPVQCTTWLKNQRQSVSWMLWIQWTTRICRDEKRQRTIFLKEFVQKCMLGMIGSLTTDNGETMKQKCNLFKTNAPWDKIWIDMINCIILTKSIAQKRKHVCATRQTYLACQMNNACFSIAAQFICSWLQTICAESAQNGHRQEEWMTFCICEHKQHHNCMSVALMSLSSCVVRLSTNSGSNQQCSCRLWCFGPNSFFLCTSFVTLGFLTHQIGLWWWILAGSQCLAVFGQQMRWQQLFVVCEIDIDRWCILGTACGQLAPVLCGTALVFELPFALGAHWQETGHGQLGLFFCELLDFVAKWWVCDGQLRICLQSFLQFDNDRMVVGRQWHCLVGQFVQLSLAFLFDWSAFGWFNLGQHVGFVAVFAVNWGHERPSCESFAAIGTHLKPNTAQCGSEGHNALCGRTLKSMHAESHPCLSLLKDSTMRNKMDIWKCVLGTSTAITPAMCHHSKEDMSPHQFNSVTTGALSVQSQSQEEKQKNDISITHCRFTCRRRLLHFQHQRQFLHLQVRRRRLWILESIECWHDVQTSKISKTATKSQQQLHKKNKQNECQNKPECKHKRKHQWRIYEQQC